MKKRHYIVIAFAFIIAFTISVMVILHLTTSSNKSSGTNQNNSKPTNPDKPTKPDKPTNPDKPDNPPNPNKPKPQESCTPTSSTILQGTECCPGLAPNYISGDDPNTCSPIFNCDTDSKSHCLDYTTSQDCLNDKQCVIGTADTGGFDDTAGHICVDKKFGPGLGFNTAAESHTCQQQMEKNKKTFDCGSKEVAEQTTIGIIGCYTGT